VYFLSVIIPEYNFLSKKQKNYVTAQKPEVFYLRRAVGAAESKFTISL